MISSARGKQLPELAAWRVRGSDALERYLSLPEVDDFESALMTSRFYRAASFEPFLRHRYDDLRADLDQWLGIARALAGDSDHTRIVARENMFPALESAARTAAALGDMRRSQELMEEIVDAIDSQDSKAWLQVGEMRRASGDERGALQAYLTSARLEIPLGRIAWYSAGRSREKLGQPGEAIQCYRNSLALWPTGVAPARRIALIEAGAA
jgi:tetratricopeptide (TPR) repeat protein